MPTKLKKPAPPPPAKADGVASEQALAKLQQDFGRAKSEVKLKYEAKIKALAEQKAAGMVTVKATEANIKALVEKKAVEIEGLTKKYNAAVHEAGTLDAKNACGTCGKEISEQELDNNDDQTKYFSCAKCNTYQCVEHTTETTQCMVCNDMYCEHCFPDEHCSGCMNVPVLTCCFA